jgi:hypothetical protein
MIKWDPFTPVGFWVSGDYTIGTITQHFTAGVSVVPEPSALLLLGSGLVGLIGFRRFTKLPPLGLKEKARVKILAFRFPLMNNGKITAYELNRHVGNGRDHFIGASPERRKNPARISEDSILKCARFLFSRMSEEDFIRLIYFVEVRI